MILRLARGPVAVVFLGSLLGSVLLLAGASALSAQAQQRLGVPTAGQEITGPVDIAAFVVPDAGVAVDYVEARLTGPVSRTLRLEPVRLADDGSQRWETALDPRSSAQTLPNGTFMLEIRTVQRGGPSLPYVGHAVELRVPPPRRTLVGEPVVGNSQQVRLSWDRVTLPDFEAYRIERRADTEGAAWSTVLDVVDQSSVEAIDTVPEEGAYRYRLAVVRGRGASPEAGDGGELRSTSPVTGVRATTQNPGTFTPPADDAVPPADSAAVPADDRTGDDEVGDDGVTDGAGPAGPGVITRPGVLPRPTSDQQADGLGGAAPAGPTQPAAGPGGGGEPELAAQVPVDPRPVPQVPPSESLEPSETAATPAPPLGTEVFEDLLPFEQTASEMVLTETETAFIDGEVIEGGSLNIYTEQRLDQQVEILSAVAAGLLLLLVSGHIRRYVAGGRR